MKPFWNTLFTLAIAFSAGRSAAAAAPVSAPVPVDFNAQVKPVLSDRCFTCHGPDENSRKGGLRLDHKAGLFAALADKGGHYVVKPGDPASSELLRRIITDDPTDRMPPTKSSLTVSPEEVARIRAWIEQGASYEEHWAFVRLRKPSIPPGEDPWIHNDIDRFVLRRLRREQLTPSPEATPEILLRRVSFDLTGLPPTPAEMGAFRADVAPGAYERAVDRLLASERYGERMAMEWLDVARYADSYGFQVDRDRRVWPWRDWVIGAFNRNLPYDQFITWQLAGDLLPDPTDEQILATAFCRLHPQKVEGGSVPEEFRVEYVADRTHTFGTAFLGLTLECARCHDHKYDPIPARDYYRLYSFFNNIDEAGLYSYFTPAVPTPTHPLTDEKNRRQREALTARVAAQEQALADIPATEEEAFQAWLSHRSPDAGIPDVLAHYAFDEEQPGKHINRVDSQAPATSTSLNRMVEGHTGKAIELTGDDAVKLTLGNFRRFQPFSISLWMWTPDRKERAVVFHRSRAWTDAASRGYQLLLEEGCLSASLIHFWPGNALRVRATDPVPLKTWTHVVMTYDGSSRADGVTLWVDGKPAALEVIRDHLTREITGGGGDEIHLGERFRDHGFAGGRMDEFGVYQRELTAIEVGQLFDGQALTARLARPRTELHVTDTALLRAYFLSTGSDTMKHQREALQEDRQELCKLQDGLQEIMVMKERSPPRPAYVLERGHYDSCGEPVQAGTPDMLPPFPPDQAVNRLGLARWLTEPTHPLTARVAVNRYWQMHFGVGLVKTVEDLGSQGERPSHPDLLDWLAASFVESGWDLKTLHRRIVTSATYRQSSRAPRSAYERDPENRLLARGSRYRLPAEMIRDQVLAASGLLVQQIGGAPVRPYDLEASFKPSKPDQGDGLYRRSLYTHWRRTGPSPLMMAFDAVKRNVCVVRRETTSSPLQSLVLLNGPQFVEAARVLATSLVRQHGDDTETLLTDTYQRLTQREPGEPERQVLRALYAEQQAYYREHPEQARALVNIGWTKPDADMDPVQVAAAGMVAQALMNFDPSVMKR